MECRLVMMRVAADDNIGFRARVYDMGYREMLMKRFLWNGEAFKERSLINFNVSDE